MNKIKKLKQTTPRRDVNFALAAGINAWVEDNLHTVQVAQRAAARATYQGLVDINQHNPFQIVPTDVVGENANWVHNCFLNVDHAAYGYYKINILNPTKFEIIPPKIIGDPFILEGEDAEIRLHAFLDELANSLDVLYEIQDGIDSYNQDKINQTLEKMVAHYREIILPELEKTKRFIDGIRGATICDTNSDVKQLASKTELRYDLALQHPRNWIVVDDLDNLDSKNEIATNALQEELMKFFFLESREAAFLYMAQKLLMTNHYKVQVVTDSAEDEPDATGFVTINPRDKFVYVKPVLHATALIASDGPPKPKPSKKNGWGAAQIVK